MGIALVIKNVKQIDEIANLNGISNLKCGI